MSRSWIGLLVLAIGTASCRGDESAESAKPLTMNAAMSQDSALVLARQLLERQPDSAYLLADRLFDAVATDSGFRFRFMRSDSGRRVPGYVEVAVRRDGRAVRVPLR